MDTLDQSSQPSQTPPVMPVATTGLSLGTKVAIGFVAVAVLGGVAFGIYLYAGAGSESDVVSSSISVSPSSNSVSDDGNSGDQYYCENHEGNIFLAFDGKNLFGTDFFSGYGPKMNVDQIAQSFMSKDGKVYLNNIDQRTGGSPSCKWFHNDYMDVGSDQVIAGYKMQKKALFFAYGETGEFTFNGKTAGGPDQDFHGSCYDKAPPAYVFELNGQVCEMQ